MSVTFSDLAPPSSTVQTITAWASPHNSVYLCVKLTFKLHWWPLFVDQFGKKCTFFTFHRGPVYPWQYIQLPGKCDIQTNGAWGLLTQDIANVLHYPVDPGWGIRSLSAGVIHSLTAQAFNSAQHHLHILDPQSNKMKYCVSWRIYLGIRYMVHQKALCLHDKVHYQLSAPLSFNCLSPLL